MMNLTQRGFGNSFSGASFSLPAPYNKKYKQKGRQVLTLQDLVQALLKLIHGLLHLISMQKLGQLFRKKYSLIQARIIKIDKLWFKMLQNNNVKAA